MNVSEFILSSIQSIGVETVFFVPGGGAMHLNDALRRSELRYIANLHEQASAIAAEANAKMTGRPGACLVTTGPGSTNAITGLVGAWQDSTPVVFIAGQVKRADSSRMRGTRTFGVQEADMESVVSRHVKYFASIDDPSKAVLEIHKALTAMMEGRPGPIWIEVPLDVQAMPIAEFQETEQTPIQFAEQTMNFESERSPSPEVMELLELIYSANRPVFLVGNGVRLAQSVDICAEFLEKVGAPILTTWASLDVFADDHPLSMGRPGSVAPRYSNFALQNADLVVALGARLDLVVTAFSHENFARAAKLVIVDIDQNEIKKMERPVTLEVNQDVKKVLLSLSEALEINRLPSLEAWWDRCRDWRERYPVVLNRHLEQDNPISTYAVSEILSQNTSTDTVYVCSSSGSAIEIFLHALRLKKGQRVIHTTGLGSMGFCLPSVVGVSQECANHKVIAIDGDGGFFFNVQELAVIATLSVSVSILVLNNNGYSSIRNSQKYWFNGATIAADADSGLHLPSVCKVAEAFGLESRRLATLSELRSNLKEITDPSSTIVWELMVDPDEQREPRVSSSVAADGRMVSRPLEDMYPFLSREELRQQMISYPTEG